MNGLNYNGSLPFHNKEEIHGPLYPEGRQSLVIKTKDQLQLQDKSDITNINQQRAEITTSSIIKKGYKKNGNNAINLDQLDATIVANSTTVKDSVDTTTE